MNWRKRPAVPPPAPEETPVAAPIVTEISSNRHDRRKLERARRKYDKFVTPLGELPEPVKRQQIKPRMPKVEIIVPADTIDDQELFIADAHHENRNDTVLYKEQEMYGEFNFRDTILQQLERYFVYIERMKKHDPDAYGYYKEVGATVLPYMASGSWNRADMLRERTDDKTRHTELSDWFHLTRPTFGCFLYGADPETEKYEKMATAHKKGFEIWVPKMLYYRKYKLPPPELQMISGGDIYAMTVWWDKPLDPKMKWGAPQEFGIFVSRDGKQVTALRQCDTELIEVPSRQERPKGRRKGGRNPDLRMRRSLGHTFVPKRAFHMPSELERWAKDNGDNVQHFLTELFKEAVQHNEGTQFSMTRVTASKGDLAATFSVNIHRTSYFFQDRDIELTDDGKRKRIFHFVRPHVRADGTQVKAHFRGENEFTWAGYDIKITIPGRDHFILADLDVGLIDQYWEEKGVKYGTPAQLGKKMKRWMNEGLGGKH
jgi:hypothetical protein